MLCVCILPGFVNLLDYGIQKKFKLRWVIVVLVCCCWCYMIIPLAYSFLSFIFYLLTFYQITRKLLWYWHYKAALLFISSLFICYHKWLMTGRMLNTTPHLLMALCPDYLDEPVPERYNQSGFTRARDSEWQWHQLGHMQIFTLLQTDNHVSTPPLSFLQAGCFFCHPANSIKALKAQC